MCSSSLGAALGPVLRKLAPPLLLSRSTGVDTDGLRGRVAELLRRLP
jgi:hypothetical protein